MKIIKTWSKALTVIVMTFVAYFILKTMGIFIAVIVAIALATRVFMSDVVSDKKG